MQENTAEQIKEQETIEVPLEQEKTNKTEKAEVTEEKEENTKSKRVYGRSLLTEK